VLLFREIVRRDLAWTLVLEDDVLMFPSFRETLQRVLDLLSRRVEYVQLGWLPTEDEQDLRFALRQRVATNSALRSLARLRWKELPQHPSPLVYAAPLWGAHCYLIARDCAEALARSAGTHFSAPVDIFLRHYFQSRSAYASESGRWARTRFPIAGQDWDMGSDVDADRFALQIVQLDDQGRRFRPKAV
jgi:GR25 family glycosyltransferase involved in LPS biosynthesis